jgi:hypothetical protein
MLLMIVFSIVGVEWFSGIGMYCIGNADPLNELDYEEAVCTNMTDHSWTSPPFHFDNSLAGIATLFLVRACRH